MYLNWIWDESGTPGIQFHGSVLRPNHFSLEIIICRSLLINGNFYLLFMLTCRSCRLESTCELVDIYLSPLRVVPIIGSAFLSSCVELSLSNTLYLFLGYQRKWCLPYTDKQLCLLSVILSNNYINQNHKLWSLGTYFNPT